MVQTSSRKKIYHKRNWKIFLSYVAQRLIRPGWESQLCQLNLGFLIHKMSQLCIPSMKLWGLKKKKKQKHHNVAYGTLQAIINDKGLALANSCCLGYVTKGVLGKNTTSYKTSVLWSSLFLLLFSHNSPSSFASQVTKLLQLYRTL